MTDICVRYTWLSRNQGWGDTFHFIIAWTYKLFYLPSPALFIRCIGVLWWPLWNMDCTFFSKLRRWPRNSSSGVGIFMLVRICSWEICCITIQLEIIHRVLVESALHTPPWHSLSVWLWQGDKLLTLLIDTQIGSLHLFEYEKTHVISKLFIMEKLHVTTQLHLEMKHIIYYLP